MARKAAPPKKRRRRWGAWIALALAVVRPGGTVELWAEEYDLTADARVWALQATGTARDVDDAAARRRRSDPDLWVIELELPEGEGVADLLGC